MCSATVFGWVQNVSADRSSAVLQKGNINAVEGDVIPLTVYFTKNGPRFLGLTVNIETGGSADGIYNACYILCMFYNIAHTLCASVPIYYKLFFSFHESSGYGL